MAQVIKSVTFADRHNAGGRTYVVAEITLGTEYLAKGVVVKPSDLGLETINFAVPVSEIMLAAEGVEAFAPSLVLTGAGTASAQVKIQVFGSGAVKKEPAFELADKAASVSEGKILIFACGKSSQL